MFAQMEDPMFGQCVVVELMVDVCSNGRPNVWAVLWLSSWLTLAQMEDPMFGQCVVVEPMVEVLLKRKTQCVGSVLW